MRIVYEYLTPPLTPHNTLAGDDICAFAGYIVSTSATPPEGTNTWRISCGGFTSTQITITPLTPTNHSVNNRQQLYDTISKDGETIIESGYRALVEPQTYSCNPCADTKSMFWAQGLFGSIICTDENAGCVFDGESSRRIFSFMELVLRL